MIVYDIEIINSPHQDSKREGYKYANGWEDYEGMGIACISWYNYTRGEYVTIDYDHANDETKQYVKRTFEEADLIIGYNNNKFDDTMMRAFGINIIQYKSYDILVNLWAASGLNMSYDKMTHAGYGLDSVAKINIGSEKSGSGSDAPFDWQDGKYDSVMKYCENDVRITKELIDKIFSEGGLVNPKTKRFVKMAMPYID